MNPKSLVYTVLPFMAWASIVGSNSKNFRDYWIWFEANVISFAAVAVVLIGFRYTWLRFAKDFVWPFWFVFLFSAAIGGMKGYLTGIWVQEASAGAMPVQSIEELVVGATIAGLVGLPLITVATNFLDEFSKQRDNLLFAKALKRIEQRDRLDHQKLQDLGKVIRDMISQIRIAGVSAKQINHEILKELVDKHVRPLATAFYADLDSKYQSFAFSELFRAAAKTSVYALPIAVAVFSYTPRASVAFGGLPGIVGMAVLSLAVFASVKITNWLNARVGLRNAVGFFLAGSIVPAAVTVFVANLIGVFRNDLINLFLVALGWYGIMAVIGNVSVLAFQTAKQNNEENRRLRQSLPESELAVLARKRKMLANQLHGEVQSRLMNLVLQAEAGNKLSSQLAIEELEAIAASLEKGPSVQLGLMESLESITNTWSGFADVQADLEPQHFPTYLHAEIAEAIREGVSNAFRHGKADFVEISSEPGGILRIRDNGIGPTAGRPGIGSRLLDRLSDSWSLRAKESGGSELFIQTRTPLPTNPVPKGK